MEQPIIIVYGDPESPKLKEAQALLAEAVKQDLVHALPAYLATDAAKRAEELVGRAVNMPHFFVGDTPPEGKRWNKRRHGGLAWGRRYLHRLYDAAATAGDDKPGLKARAQKVQDTPPKKDPEPDVRTIALSMFIHGDMSSPEVRGVTSRLQPTEGFAAAPVVDVDRWSAGRKSRMPFFFVGKPPAEGKAWPRDRCGGLAWITKRLDERDAAADPPKPARAAEAKEDDDETIKRLRMEADVLAENFDIVDRKLKAERKTSRSLRKELKEKTELADTQMDTANRLAQSLEAAKSAKSQLNTENAAMLSRCHRAKDRIFAALEYLNVANEPGAGRLADAVHELNAAVGQIDMAVFGHVEGYKGVRVDAAE